MDDTKIEWADATWNPVRGCRKISPGCAHCYAEAMSGRNPAALGEWGPEARRAHAAESYWRLPAKWNRQAEAEGRVCRVFVASLADMFEGEQERQAGRWIEHRDGPRPDYLPVLARMVETFAPLDNLIPMVLTKRPWNMAAWADRHGWPARWWAGTTVEDQQRADERVPELLRVPAAVRFLSCEPLLGAVDLALTCFNGADSFGTMPGLHWIIVGGESGPKARPMHPAWARSLRDQAQAAGVAFHFKQWGEWAPEWRTDLVHGAPGELRGPWTTVSSTERRSIGQQSWHAYPTDMRPDADGFARFDVLHRFGKHTAGRLLDDRTWDEVPDAC